MSERELVVLDYDESGNEVVGYADEQSVAEMFHAGDFLGPRVPGYNVDRINVDAGMAALRDCGYDDPFTDMVVAHALNLWRRGEEAQAQKNAIDKSFYGINLTSWYRVLAAAMAGADA